VKLKGCIKTVHHPEEATAEEGRKEVINNPTVGKIQIIAIRIIKIWIGAPRKN